jgi:hypothetical protein
MFDTALSLRFLTSSMCSIFFRILYFLAHIGKPPLAPLAPAPPKHHSHGKSGGSSARQNAVGVGKTNGTAMTTPISHRPRSESATSSINATTVAVGHKRPTPESSGSNSSVGYGAGGGGPIKKKPYRRTKRPANYCDKSTVTVTTTARGMYVVSVRIVVSSMSLNLLLQLAYLRSFDNCVCCNPIVLSSLKREYVHFSTTICFVNELTFFS